MAPRVSILMYHQIGWFAAPAKHRAGYCHVRRFRAQMALLKWSGYRVLTLDEALAGLFHGQSLPPRAVVLTFDDGYQSFAEHAAPILAEHGFPATVFLVTGRVGAQADWLSDGQVHAPLMAAATIRRLHRDGFAFGSHTLDHPRLSQLARDEQCRQIADSKAWLEDLLGEPVVHFCYPYGDYDEPVRELVREAGYASALSCIRGAAGTAVNPWEIPRKAISYGDNLLGYWWKLAIKNAPKGSPQS